MPTPTSLLVVLMYVILFLLFPPRRSRWTWVGAALGIVVLAAAITYPSIKTSQVCEITILDSTVGLDGVVVAPGGERLVFSGARPLWPGQKGGGPGPLPAYLHWRLYRTLDAVVALPLNSRNAPELLALAQEFRVGGFWWRQERQPEGPMVELINLLGDQGKPARSLDRGNPPQALGEVFLAYPSWEGGQAGALEVTYQGRRVLLLPPLRRAALLKLPWPARDRPLAALVAPGDVPAELLKRLNPERLVLFGEPAEGKEFPSCPVFFSRWGAVSLHLAPGSVTVQEWSP
uniref:DUF4131 domain-containing protein n=1 Tax=Desulfobacca acetoxidans TaxID=60893 RepID=A0A7V4G766_9BACT